MLGLTAVLYFLSTLTISFLLFILWARFLLRYFHISTLHPISQSIDSVIAPFIKPIERIIYLKQSAFGRYDWASFILILIVELIKFTLLGLFAYKSFLPPSYLILFITADLIVQPCNLLFYLILIRFIMTWINSQGSQNPLSNLIHLMTTPLFQQIHRWFPKIKFAYLPVIILILLKVITLFISASMPLKLM